MLTLTLPSALAAIGPKVINSMRSERVQFNALCVQNMCNVWRKNAMRALVDSHGDFKVNAVDSIGQELTQVIIGSGHDGIGSS